MQGRFAPHQIQGDSPRASLPVGVPAAKSNNQAKYVELAVEDLRTRVRFPPPPPKVKPNRSPGWAFSCARAINFLIDIAVGEEFQPRN